MKRWAGESRGNVVEERLRFVILANLKERRIKDLCAEFGISRQTGNTWLKRYRAEGSGGMSDRSRRPLNSPRRTTSAREQAVVDLRREYPDWGAAKLASILRGHQPGVELTTRTVHRILDRRNLIAQASGQ